MKKLSDLTVLVDEDLYCPVCGAYINAATASDGTCAEPSPGDVSVCSTCTSYLIFNDDLTSRELTVDEFVNLPSNIIHALTKGRAILKNINKVRQNGS